MPMLGLPECRGRFTPQLQVIPGKYCDFSATDSGKKRKALINVVT
jgi:hypothetical protein